MLQLVSAHILEANIRLTRYRRIIAMYITLYYLALSMFMVEISTHIL